MDFRGSQRRTAQLCVELNCLITDTIILFFFLDVILDSLHIFSICSCRKLAQSFNLMLLTFVALYKIPGPMYYITCLIVFPESWIVRALTLIFVFHHSIANVFT